MGVPFEVGVISQGAALALALGLGVYAVGTIVYTMRAFRVGLEDRWSSMVASGVMVALSAAMAAFGAHVLPAPFSLWALLVWVGAIIFTFTYTASELHDRIEAFQDRFGDRFNQLLEDKLPEDRLAALQDLRARWQEDKEGRRKAPHLLMGLFVVFYAAVGYVAVRGIWLGLYGGSPAGGGEAATNLFLAAHADPGAYLVPGHLFGLSLALMLLFVIAPTELLRLKYPETGYPFKAVILNNLRDKEAGLFGAHYYITASVSLAALWLARDPATWDTGIPAVMATVAVTVFADTASALFGIRFGKRHLPHNSGKTYVGTVAGGLVAAAVALPFVGIWVGLASAVVFIVVDVAAPVPINVSDNLLNPIALAAVYTVLQGSIDPLIPFY